MKHYLFAIFLALSSATWSQELLSVKELHTFATGYAGSKSATYQIFEQELNKAEAARPVFEKCLKSGTPAAKLYGAMGLYSLDAAEGKEALKRLAKSEGKVKVLSGCILSEYKVSEVADELLNSEDGLSVHSFLLPLNFQF